MQKSCGFPWCRASEFLLGHRFHAVISLPNMVVTADCVGGNRGSYFSVVWILRTVNILSAISDAEKIDVLSILSLSPQSNRKKSGVHCCWLQHNNMERGSNVWILWDNLELWSKGWFAGLVNAEYHCAWTVSPFLVCTKKDNMLSRLLQWPQMALTHYCRMKWNQSCLFSNWYDIKMHKYILVYFPPPTAILSNSSNHSKCYYPLVTGSQDHQSFVNEWEKATFFQLKFI